MLHFYSQQFYPIENATHASYVFPEPIDTLTMKMLSMNKTLVSILATTAVCFSSANGQVTITTDGSNNATVESIEANGFVYSESDFIGADVTAFNMHTGTDTYQVVASGEGPFTGTAATGLMEDLHMTTGYAGLRNLSYSFLDPVVNNDGIDLFIFEYGIAETSALDVTLNSTTIDVAAGGNPFTSFATVAGTLNREVGETATSIALLESYAFNGPKINQSGISIGYLGIDLSDYGVGDGASVSTLSLAGTGDYDITGVIGLSSIPEPSTYALGMGSALLAILLLRRRVQR